MAGGSPKFGSPSAGHGRVVSRRNSFERRLTVDATTRTMPAHVTTAASGYGSALVGLSFAMLEAEFEQHVRRYMVATRQSHGSHVAVI